MRRTQLYLEDEVWAALHARARREKRTVSDLVRAAVRDAYLRPDRREAMRAVIGLWADRDDLPPTDVSVRGLRHDRRSRASHVRRSD